MARSMASGCKATFLFLFYLTLLVGTQGYDQRKLAYRGSGIWSGNIYIAAFGDPMVRSKRFELLRPPEGHDLCSHVPINDPLNPGLNISDQFLDYETPMGLLVPRGSGACSEEVQTMVALEIQKNIPALRFLVIHAADDVVGSTPVTLNILGGDNGAYDGIGVMYMPYTEYTKINGYLVEETAKQSASPYLLEPTSGKWEFWVSVSGKVVVRTEPDSETELEIFYWLRLVLFVVLIVTPCFRACFLWYSGGGRLHWRRDDNGRIIGILYVPPMPIWLWMQRNPQQAGEPISQKLSEEQFETLPVIKYQRSKKYREDPSESGVGVGENEQDLELGDTVVGEEPNRPKGEEKPMDIEMQRTEDTEDMNLLPSLGSLSDGSDDESPPASPLAQPSSDDPNELSTTCTMCSICIDDFEAGEELVLLPRCRHAFHKECIHPWLLERQGCCPLCKVKVLDDGSEDTTEEGDATAADGSSPTIREDTVPDEETTPRREDTVPDEEETATTGSQDQTTEPSDDPKDEAVDVPV